MPKLTVFVVSAAKYLLKERRFLLTAVGVFVAFTLFTALVLVVPGTNAWAENIICTTGVKCDGTVRADNILGTASDDVIDGKARGDHIWSFQGADIITGGAGDDAIGGGDGFDSLSGDGFLRLGTAGWFLGRCPPESEAGNDGISGDEGDDFIRGCGGFDLLYGGDGNDEMIGNEGNDIMVGGAGSDTVDGGPGRDECEAETEINCEA
jgi:Ca2+-binding RTX toxin-like protein